jgi:hypothetical protein
MDAQSSRFRFEFSHHCPRQSCKLARVYSPCNLSWHPCWNCHARVSLPRIVRLFQDLRLALGPAAAQGLLTMPWHHTTYTVMLEMTEAIERRIPGFLER